MMAKPQNPMHLLLLPLLVLCTTTTLTDGSPPVELAGCSHPPFKPTCNAFLYYISTGQSLQDVATLYNANSSLVKPITNNGKRDYLVSVPCKCETVDNVTAYFHDTTYFVLADDTPASVSTNIFSGQAYDVGEGKKLYPNTTIPIRLLCSCSTTAGGENLVMVTYTVQQDDTLGSIAALMSTDVESIQALNERLAANPELLLPGSVLFVPNGTTLGSTSSIAPAPQQAKKKKSYTAFIVAFSVAAALLLIGAVILFLCSKSRSRQLTNADNEKSLVIRSIAALERHLTPKEFADYVPPFESERPVIFSFKELEDATSNFDETKIIGEGGYGSVYFGILGNQELAIKKMKSSKSREFFAELKVLCKVHHINVVELIGYTSSEDHLYLVYEFVQNGSLSDHLHDSLLKGYQPLSWNARAQIALDAARGIEYIHDQTKARYVHRDIKTSNILLDNGLRAKVADFGLAKLVERSGEDCYATRLVGTPGYLPPESVRELQMTTKTDVFAFGVVLAELITGFRALVRDNNEPNKIRSLISIIIDVFQDEDPETALQAIVDRNLKGNYPMQEVYKMAEISVWCLNEESVNRPEMREITVKLSQILVASIEWESSIGGDSQVFSGVLSGR